MNPFNEIGFASCFELFLDKIFYCFDIVVGDLFNFLDAFSLRNSKFVFYVFQLVVCGAGKREEKVNGLWSIGNSQLAIVNSESGIIQFTEACLLAFSH